MASKYENLFNGEKNQYLKECPVVLAGCAMLKHKENGTLVAQLKFQSLSEKTINAVKVRLRYFDPAKKDAGEQVYTYLDLSVDEGEDFGSRTPLIVDNPLARSFETIVEQVVFSDGEVWENDRAFEGSLGEPESLFEMFKENSFRKGIRSKFGPYADYKPGDRGDYWTCICGAVHTKDVQECGRCSHKFDEVVGVDYEALAVDFDKDERYEKTLAAEKIAFREKDLINAAQQFEALDGWKDSTEHAAACRKKAEDLKQKKEHGKETIEKQANKAKKLLPVIIIVAVLLAAFFGGRAFVYKQADAGKFETASSLKFLTIGDSEFSKYVDSGVEFNKQNYEKSGEGFKELGDYRKAYDYYQESYYQLGVKEYDDENYEESIKAFSEVSDYKDTGIYMDKMLDKAYEQAKIYYANGDYKKAENLFSLLRGSGPDNYLACIKVCKGDASVTTLKDIMDFEGAQQAVFSSEENTASFLFGTWKTSDGEEDFSLTGTVDEWDAEWSIPSNDDENAEATFDNGKLCDVTDSGNVPYFEFSIQGWNQISIKSLANGRTYTLYRR